MIKRILLITVLCIQSSLQDIYLHNVRGSNNRLNEKSAQRTNDNRLFDSENNERGGYNVGDRLNTPFQTEDDQYQMRYFQSGSNGDSYLTLEWTHQHGCGGNEDSDPTKQNCYLILQYMCEDIKDATNLDRLRDGLNTQSQGFTNMQAEDSKTANLNRKQNDVKLNCGLHETWEWYDKCKYRERNKNLFTADQNLRSNERGYSGAIYTRQNPNGDRSGYECPEERDYYPYWHPSPWKDIAILTSNITLCDKIYSGKSFNEQPYYECVQLYPDQSRKHWSRYNNQNDCVNNNGTWTQFYNYLEKATQYKSQSQCESQTNSNLNYKWAVPYDTDNPSKKECLVLLSSPICTQADWTRSNHLGNTREGEPSRFTWTLPYFPSKTLKKCVFRIRYNITTDDYDPFNTDSQSNNQNSPIQTNPTINIGANNKPLRLAINTAQYGRVFQDRSHTFYLLPRSSNIDNVVIYNLNVRGKRGNIVQTYPAVEYDFIPNILNVKTADLIHIQWTGSNTHNNGNPAGDGQAGDDGQGQGGTDRSNFVQITELNENYPLPYESCDLWNSLKAIGLLNADQLNQSGSYLKMNTINSKDLALYFASSGYYECEKTSTCQNSVEAKAKLDSDLNASPASFPGALIKFNTANKVFYYMSSRNNNFSNRSQKGRIIVS